MSEHGIITPQSSFRRRRFITRPQPPRGRRHQACAAAFQYCRDAEIPKGSDIEEGSMDRVISSLDVIGTNAGKVTLETIRQAAARKAAATTGPQGHQAAAAKAARTRKRKAAAAKASATKGPQGHRAAAIKAARTRKRKAAAAKASATKGPQGHHAAAVKAARTRKLKAATSKVSAP